MEVFILVLQIITVITLIVLIWMLHNLDQKVKKYDKELQVFAGVVQEVDKVASDAHQAVKKIIDDPQLALNSARNYIDNTVKPYIKSHQLGYT